MRFLYFFEHFNSGVSISDKYILAVICDGNPPNLSHSTRTWNPEDNYYLSVAEYTCEQGYNFTQNVTRLKITCRENREWTPDKREVFNEGCVGR